MSDGTRRTLEELITLYQEEPELSEVITEGRTDAGLLTWYLRRQGHDTRVFAIDDRLTVTASEVRQRGQDRGCKGRLIAAALYLNETSVEGTQRVTFIADVDTNIAVGHPLEGADCLLWTDYTSMEMYCYAKNPIDKFLRVCLRAPEAVKAESVLAAIRDCLVEIFYIRIVLSFLEDPKSMASNFDRKLRVIDNDVDVDIKTLIRDSVKTKGVDVDELIKSQRLKRSTCPSDERMAIRGHDFIQVCCFYLKTAHSGLFKDDRAAYKSAQVFGNALIACLELPDLSSENLFQRLTERLRL
jgi:hypothetical protein